MKRNTTTVLDTDHEGDLNATTAVSDETVGFHACVGDGVYGLDVKRQIGMG